MITMTKIFGITIVVFLLFGGNCYGGGNEIFGCYQKNGGDLRIVKHPGLCRHSEIPISWNKVGPAGPEGPQGPQGPAGPQGPQGLQGSLAQSEEVPKVYDAESQFLGIFPSTWDGYLSFFVPTLSRFVSLSPYSGDVASFISVQVYYDGSGCTGNSYLDAGMRYQIMKLESKYIMAEDTDATCKYYVSVAEMIYNELGGLSLQCNSLSKGTKCNLLPSKEVSLPFSLPVAHPVQFK